MIEESEHPYSRVSYKNDLTDTDRWAHFVAHEDDIFVVTPSKNGTTWMQTIVTFLVFGASELDFVPAERSPWFDVTFMPLPEAQAALERDDMRNIIKTHTPLDGIPFYESSTYIGVYRDPRDAFFSMRNHADNMVMDIGLKGRPVEEQFRFWLEGDLESEGSERVLAYPVHHLKCLWDQRHRPNVHLFHYSDLLRDLKGEMQRVAQAINVEVDEPLLSELVDAATFSSMRSNFEKFVPGQAGGFWHEPKEFLKQGTSGQWQGAVSSELLERFDVRLNELAGDEMAHWMLHGNGPD
jgi:aryl sulfotransferase